MSRVRIRIEPRCFVIEVPRAAHLADPLAAEPGFADAFADAMGFTTETAWPRVAALA